MTDNWQRKSTKLGIVAIVIAVAAWDIYAYLSAGGNATVSRVLLRWSSDYPPMPLGVGFVLGHLFWPQIKRIKK